MFTTRRGWSCATFCDPTRPCYGPGCPNARYPNAYYPCYNPGFRPCPNSNPGPFPFYNLNPPPFWGRWNSAPPRPPPSPPRPQAYSGPNGPDGTVRIGVGDVSNADIDVDVRDNLVMGGRRRVDIVSGKYGAQSNMVVIANNRGDADELMIGSDNYSMGGDNNIRVTNTDFSGCGGVKIGSGNYASGGNRIVVDMFGSDCGVYAGSNARPQPEGDQQRRRWWLF